MASQPSVHSGGVSGGGSMTVAVGIAVAVAVYVDLAEAVAVTVAVAVGCIDFGNIIYARQEIMWSPKCGNFQYLPNIHVYVNILHKL